MRNSESTYLPLPLTFDFRTFEKNSLLFYASTSLNADPVSLFSVEIVDEFLQVVFNLKSFNLPLIKWTSTKKVSDGKWKDFHFSYDLEKLKYTIGLSDEIKRSTFLGLSDFNKLQPESNNKQIGSFPVVQIDDSIKFVYFGGIDYKKTSSGTSFDLPDDVGSAQLGNNFNGCFRNIKFSTENLPLDQLLKFNYKENTNYGLSLGCNVPCLGKCSSTGKCSKNDGMADGSDGGKVYGGRKAQSLKKVEVVSSIFQLEKNGNKPAPKCLNNGRCMREFVIKGEL